MTGGNIIVMLKESHMALDMKQEMLLVVVSTSSRTLLSSPRTVRGWVGDKEPLQMSSYTDVRSPDTAFRDIKGRLYPMIGIGDLGAEVTVNFGQKDFLYKGLD